MSGALGTGMDSKHTAQHGIFGIPKGLDGGIVAGEFRGCGHGWGVVSGRHGGWLQLSQYSESNKIPIFSLHGGLDKTA